MIEERRKNYPNLTEDIGYIKGKIEGLDKRINGTIDDFVHHMKSGHRWRATIITVSLVVILEIIGFAFLWGLQTKTIEFIGESVKVNSNMLAEHIKESYAGERPIIRRIE